MDYEETRIVELEISGMTCGKCVARVNDALSGLSEVESVEVSRDPGRAFVEVGSVSDEVVKTLVSAVEEAGYEARSRESDEPNSEPVETAPEPEKTPDESTEPSSDLAQARVEIDGMTCASCVSRVQKALEDVEGVRRVAVNFATEAASIDYDPSIDDSTLRERAGEAIDRAGYEVREEKSSGGQTTETSRVSDRRAKEAQEWKLRWIWGLVLTLPIVGLQMGPMWFGLELSRAGESLRLGTLAYLTAVTLVYVGWPYLQGAWKGLKHFSANMDTLVALGSSVAFVFSTIQAVRFFAGAEGDLEVYFDGAAMILTLISVGKWLEARAKGRAGEALEGLLDLGAKKAKVQRNGSWVEVEVSELEVGDIVRVSAGEKIPTDGVVVDGRAHVDASMITGESVPVAKVEGDEVIGATVNTDGRLDIEVTEVGAQTALAQIVAQVEKAQESKADIERLADRVSSIFVPAVIVVAVVTFVSWFVASGSVATAVLPAVAVLIVACPCALGLATPTAIMVGTSVAARSGILIREAQSLERAREIDAVIFDKTGTLTTGKMSVTKVIGEPTDELLELAASVESSSRHPIAQAIVRHAEEHFDGFEASDVDDFEDEAGNGVTGSVGPTRVRVGKVAWLADDLGEELVERAEEQMQSGQTVIAVVADSVGSGLIALRDSPKPGAADVVGTLKERGVEVWLITGDHAETAAAIADELGIDSTNVRASVMPGDKADAVRSIQESGRKVAMVGDGINDAPALTQADLGIALGSGTDLAMQAADITLVSDRLESVIHAIDASRKTHQKIRQNLFWAFVYNTGLIPVAALGLLHPALAAGAMALSSVSVVTNSLLLKRGMAKVT